MQIEEIHFETIDSTNAYAKRECRFFPTDRIICVSADEQTAGVGRYGRKWVSPKGVNLYATLCFKLPQNLPDLGCLAILAAYSLASLLLESGLRPKIKWPNDVRLNGKKVSGILCETIFEPKEVQVLLGIGVNVNMGKKDLDRIDQPATSLKEETGKTWDRAALLKRYLRHFEADLERFKAQGFAPFHGPVEQILAFKGETVRCFDGENEWSGVLRSLGTDGCLHLDLPDGSHRSFHSGDLLPPKQD